MMTESTIVRKRRQNSPVKSFAAARSVNAAYREHYPELAIPNPDAEIVPGKL